MGLPRRLAIFAALVSAALVLGVTELSLALSERSRLDDIRLEAMAIASTLADYLNRAAPSGDPAALDAALSAWAGLHLRQTSAVVFATDRAGRVTLATRTDSLRPVGLAPEDRARRLATLPDAEGRVVDGAGHYIHVECPDATIAHLEAFLAR